MKKLVIKALVVLGMMAAVGSQLHAYCFYLHSPENLEVWVLKSRSDWDKLDLSKKFSDAATKILQEGGKITGAVPHPTASLVGNAVVAITPELSKLINLTEELILVKARHHLRGGSHATPVRACWNWKSVEDQLGKGRMSSLYAVIFDKINNTLLGTFEFQSGGYVRLKIINGKLEIATSLYTGVGDYPYKLEWKSAGMDIGL